MKTLRIVTLMAAMTAAASPVLAADQLFQHQDNELILSTFDGRPFWELQAVCAGYHGATANYFAKQGEASKASAAEAAGVAALNDAVIQLRHDRGITDAAAVKVAEPIVQVGGRVTAEALRNDGLDTKGRWNYWRSFCLDARVAYNRASH